MTYRKLHTPISPDQTAVIPYHIRNGEIEVLLITTRKKGKWIVPKGSLEEELSAYEQAEVEAHEEAGVVGEVAPVSLGCYRHGGSKKSPIVEVFLMRVEQQLDAWPEDDERERRWVSLDEAYRHVDEEGLSSILDEARALIQQSLVREIDGVQAQIHPALPEGED